MASLSTLLEQLMALSGLQKAGLLAGVGVLYFLTKYLYWRINEKMKPFNAYTTNQEAINGLDLKDKVAVVTGANNGIGLETTRVLARQGCTVIMACRSMDKAENAKRDITESLKGSIDDEQLKTMQLDLSSMASVAKFAKAFNAQNRKIDYLVNNAGIMALPEYRESEDGFEMQFATNHLGHFLLTHLLMPSLLRKSASGSSSGKKRLPRVINLSSTANRYLADYDYALKVFGDCLKSKDFMGEHKGEYGAWLNYGFSKAANILFAQELQKRTKGQLVTVSVHPGGVNTGLSKHMTPKALLQFLGLVIRNPSFAYKNMKSTEQGAACSLRCVSLGDEEIAQGCYYFNCNDGTGLLQGACKEAHGDGGKLAAMLWDLSAALVAKKGFSLKP